MVFFLVGRRRGCLAAQQSNGSVVDLGHLGTANHLELTTGNHHGDHAFQMLNHLFIGLALILQDKAQPGKAVGNLLYIGFAADIVKNVLGNFRVIHFFLLRLFGWITEARAANREYVFLHKKDPMKTTTSQ